VITLFFARCCRSNRRLVTLLFISCMVSLILALALFLHDINQSWLPSA
jgi:hypothetical protein